ncbi:hypothetical protein LEP1GSC137_1017 [Leptospira borgpetersenii str. Noumea 25]|nr:hypothetical protein LEP1GSC137_1017 [Leptospira borgpetersenii str. Noumea 25]
MSFKNDRHSIKGGEIFPFPGILRGLVLDFVYINLPNGNFRLIFFFSSKKKKLKARATNAKRRRNIRFKILHLLVYAFE